jgi:hypothetical protein
VRDVREANADEIEHGSVGDASLSVLSTLPASPHTH